MNNQNGWDEETDVVVVGYGGAGAVTAITAHDAGVRVLILKKQPDLLVANTGHSWQLNIITHIQQLFHFRHQALLYHIVDSPVNAAIQLRPVCG